jgi:uncharacterized protein DUF5995/polyketide cyclase/dehydrase/lipid transport protein
MDIVREKLLACAPEVAFALATEPARMCTWSRAAITSLSLGDGAHPAGVGALRRVDLPGRPRLRATEVVAVSDPPERFVYRVIDGIPIRAHRGEMTFASVTGGTSIRWHVHLEFPLAAAVVEAVVRQSMLPELDASIEELARVAPSAAATELPPRRTITDDLAPVLARAGAVREEQRALADELEGRGDERHWFTRVYQHVTDHLLDAARGGVFLHPGWVLRLVERFHRYYVQSMHGPAERHWATAFARMAALDGPRFRRMGAAVFWGMKAHIEDDLPRALAETYARHYAGRCDYVRFRADYQAMAPIFLDAGDRLLEALAASEIPLRTRVLRSILPREARERLLARQMYDIPRERRKAFDRGEGLVRLVMRDGAG